MIINIVKDVVNLILAIFQNCKFNGNIFWIIIMVREICAKRMMKQLMLILIHALLRFNYFTTVGLQRPCVKYISIFLCIHIIWNLRNINHLQKILDCNLRYGNQNDFFKLQVSIIMNIFLKLHPSPFAWCLFQYLDIYLQINIFYICPINKSLKNLNYAIPAPPFF